MKTTQGQKNLSPKNIKESNNVITYTAKEKLEETNGKEGFHTDAFNVPVESHTFSKGTGTIIFAGKVTTIGKRAFNFCKGLTSITIPNSVTTIGYSAFAGCQVLKSITLPHSVKIIGASAFEYCRSLTSIVIPDSVIEIRDSAFYDCSSLKSITIPDSVTTIGDWAFCGCSSLKSITIPNSVKWIGKEGTFDGCKKLTSINVDAANRHYSSIDGVLFNYAKDTLIQYPAGKAQPTYTIPDSVIEIGLLAFEDCTNISEIIVPHGKKKHFVKMLKPWLGKRYIIIEKE